MYRYFKMRVESARDAKFDKKYAEMKSAEEFEKKVTEIENGIDLEKSSIIGWKEKVREGEAAIDGLTRISLNEARDVVKRVDLRELERDLQGDSLGHPLVEKTLQAVFVLTEQTHFPKMSDLSIPSVEEIERRLSSGCSPAKIRDKLVSFDCRQISDSQRRFIRRHFLIDTARRISEKRKMKFVLDFWCRDCVAMEKKGVAVYLPTDVRGLLAMFSGTSAPTIAYAYVALVSNTVARFAQFVAVACEWNGLWWMGVEPFVKQIDQARLRIKKMENELTYLRHRIDTLQTS